MASFDLFYFSLVRVGNVTSSAAATWQLPIGQPSVTWQPRQRRPTPATVGQRRSTPPATGQRRRVTVVIGGQRWRPTPPTTGQRRRSTTVAGGEPPLTAAGPPLTTTGPPVNGGRWAGQLRAWAGSWSGLDRVQVGSATCQPHVHTWHPHGADVDNMHKEYLEKVTKHQRYLIGEKGSDPDSPTPKSAKATKKSKPSAPKADLRPPVTKPASSQQHKPKPAPAKSQGKKHKLVTKSSDKPFPARRSKPGLVTKRRKPTSSLRSVDESVDEGIPEKEPRFDVEEADVQRALEESLKSVYDAPRGLLPPMVIRETESGKYQPLPETPKKKSHTDQFIFQRRTSTPTEFSDHDESFSLYVELGLTNSKVESDEDVSGIDVGVQDKGHARLNPGEHDEGQAGLNPGDVAASQPQSSHVVHAGPNLEHIDLEAMDVSSQLHPEKMNEGFTTTAYPSVQENLKLIVEEQMILEEPASSTATLSSL
nr:hypothetical protein [Tanacetum cinerariifolium]